MEGGLGKYCDVFKTVCRKLVCFLSIFENLKEQRMYFQVIFVGEEYFHKILKAEIALERLEGLVLAS